MLPAPLQPNKPDPGAILSPSFFSFPFSLKAPNPDTASGALQASDRNYRPLQVVVCSGVSGRGSAGPWKTVRGAVMETADSGGQCIVSAGGSRQFSVSVQALQGVCQAASQACVRLSS